MKKSTTSIVLSKRVKRGDPMQSVTGRGSATETLEPYAQKRAQEVPCTTLGLARRPDLARSRELGRWPDGFYLGKLTVGILSRNIPWGENQSQSYPFR
ncbi:hypothetical protein GQ457_12G030170 [Hibiscus cannabinus]